MEKRTIGMARHRALNHACSIQGCSPHDAFLLPRVIFIFPSWQRSTRLFALVLCCTGSGTCLPRVECLLPVILAMVAWSVHGRYLRKVVQAVVWSPRVALEAERCVRTG